MTISIPVQFVNEQSFARSGVVTFGAKVADGDLTSTTTELKITGATGTEERVQWTPFGVRYASGAIKYIECTVPVSLTSTQNKQGTITAGTSNTLRPFTIHPAVVEAFTLNNGRTNLQMQLDFVMIDDFGHFLSVPFDIPILTPAPGKSLLIAGGQGNDHTATFRSFSRLPGQFGQIGVELVLEVMSNSPVIKFWLCITNSINERGSGRNPGQFPSTKVQFVEQNLNLNVNSFARLAIRDAERKLPFDVAGNQAVLIDPDLPDVGRVTGRFASGQSLCYEGVLCCGTPNDNESAELLGEITAMAMDWRDRGIPPFNLVLDYPSYIANRAAGITRIETDRTSWHDYPLGDGRGPWIWGWPITGNPNSTDTGDQGLATAPVRGWPMLLTGWPTPNTLIKAAIRNILARPNTYLEPNGDLWNPEDYPDCWLWSGVPFFTGGDWLGRSRTLALNQDLPQSAANRYPFGPDRQHWMHPFENYGVFVTRDFFAKKFANVMAKQYIAAHYTDRGFGGELPNPDAARALRAMLHMCAIYEATADARLLHWMTERIKLYQANVWRDGATYDPYQLWAFETVAPGTQSGLLLTKEAINPWQNGYTVAGLYAYWLLVGGTPEGIWARDRAFRFAGTIAMYGYQDRRTTVQNVVVRQDAGHTTGVTGGHLWRTAVVGKTAVGQTSGATGVIVHVDNRFNGFYRLHLKNCTGQFAVPENILIDGTITAEITIRNNGLIGCTALASGTTQDGVPPTSAQMEAIHVSATKTANITAATNTAPIQITVDTPNAFADWSIAHITGVGGNTAANGNWQLRQISATVYSLTNSTGNGSYTSGGTATVETFDLENVKWGDGAGYQFWQIPGLIIAELAAQQNFYGARSAEVAAQARNFINALAPTSHATWDPNTEFFALVPDPFNSGGNPTLPADPSNLRLTAFETHIVVQWNDNSTNETSFSLEHCEDGVSFTELATPAANATLYDHTGLEADTPHFYRIRAHNGVGYSGYSNTANVNTLPGATPPTAPSSCTIDSPTTTDRITVRWTDNSNNEDLFSVEVSSDNFSTISSRSIVGPNITNTIVTGLAASTTYKARVQAINATGSSAFATSANATTLGSIAAPPNAPSNLTATGGVRQIVLAWTDNSSDETGFEVEYLTSDGWALLVLKNANSTSHTHSGLADAQTVHYRVRAISGNGNSAYSNIAFATTDQAAPGGTIPTAPSNLSLIEVGPNWASIQWKDNADNETKFYIERKRAQSYDTAPGSLEDTPIAEAFYEAFAPTDEGHLLQTLDWERIAQVDANKSSYFDNGPLAPLTEVLYRVIAANQYGESSPSNELLVLTTAPSPGGGQIATRAQIIGRLVMFAQDYFDLIFYGEIKGNTK